MHFTGVAGRCSRWMAGVGVQDCDATIQASGPDSWVWFGLRYKSHVTAAFFWTKTERNRSLTFTRCRECLNITVKKLNNAGVTMIEQIKYAVSQHTFSISATCRLINNISSLSE